MNIIGLIVAIFFSAGLILTVGYFTNIFPAPLRFNN